jgi:putative ABC transport system permease protein
MKGILFLAWRYSASHRAKTAILVASVTLVVWLPAGLRVLVDRTAERLVERAVETPLVIGAKGSPLELVLNTLYFRSEVPERMAYREVTEVAQTGLGRAIPMYVRFRARGLPIVGTTVEYFDLRGLRLDAGRPLALLGECVLGAEAARSLDASVGDGVVSSPESAFDLAGVYPLRLKVVGILEPAGSHDDRAVFVDIKTAWIIEGLGHGHEDLSKPGAAAGVLSRKGREVTANASVRMFREIDAENAAGIHFHGDTGGFPVTAIIAVPSDHRSATLLRGRYEKADATHQALRPRDVVSELLATVFTVRRYVVMGMVVVGVAALATLVLVLLLSLRLRRREMETLSRIGVPRRLIAALMGSEGALVLGAGVLLAGLLTLVTASFGDALMDLWVG